MGRVKSGQLADNRKINRLKESLKLLRWLATFFYFYLKGVTRMITLVSNSGVAYFNATEKDIPSLPTKAKTGTPLPNGSYCLLIDTQSAIFFDEEVDDWLDENGERLHV
jgi:hypothetical protein